MIQACHFVHVPPDRGVLRSSAESKGWAEKLLKEMHRNLQQSGSPTLHHVETLRSLGFSGKKVSGVVNVGIRLNWWRLTRTSEKGQNTLTLIQQVI